MLAKAKEDFSDKIKAKFIQEMSSSQTAAPSTPCAGPVNVAVSTILSSQNLALHLRGYDAPHDPRLKDMSRSFLAPVAVACDAACLAFSNHVCNAPLRFS